MLQISEVEYATLKEELAAAKEWHDQVAIVAKKWAFDHGGFHCTPTAIAAFLLERAVEIDRMKPVVEAAQIWATVCAPADVHPADEERVAIALVEAVDCYEMETK